MSLEPSREARFPNLRRGSYRISSPGTDEYNCLAWAAEDDAQWWEPSASVGHSWPPNVPLEGTVDGVALAYESLGFERYKNREVEDGYVKVAIYAAPDGEVTHAARQLDNGWWTSKLGEWQDIAHADLQSLEGQYYGVVALILRRRRVTH